jgi:hypothetical protein
MIMAHAHNANGLWADINDYFFEGWASLSEDRAIALLQRLHTPEARKAFADRRLRYLEPKYQYGK